jgi:hypothetical protein
MLFVEGIISTVMTRPDEEWLIIHHKADIDMDFEEEVRARLPLFGPKVHFCHWGVHDATNRFAAVPNVILAGTLFMRTSHYEALGRLASAYPSSRGRFDPNEITMVTLGEHRHMILQALCRGAARKCDGSGCPPARAYIIASHRSGITQQLPSIFPGANIHRWEPVKRTSKAKLRRPSSTSRSNYSEGHGLTSRFVRLWIKLAGLTARTSSGMSVAIMTSWTPLQRKGSRRLGAVSGRQASNELQARKATAASDYPHSHLAIAGGCPRPAYLLNVVLGHPPPIKYPIQQGDRRLMSEVLVPGCLLTAPTLAC